MALLDKQESRRCVETVWGKLIPGVLLAELGDVALVEECPHVLLA